MLSLIPFTTWSDENYSQKEWFCFKDYFWISLNLITFVFEVQLLKKEKVIGQRIPGQDWGAVGSRPGSSTNEPTTVDASFNLAGPSALIY